MVENCKLRYHLFSRKPRRMGLYNVSCSRFNINGNIRSIFLDIDIFSRMDGEKCIYCGNHGNI